MEPNLSVFILLGLLLFFGFFAGQIADYFNYPRVVGYILIGAVFSQDLLGQYFMFHENPLMELGPELATKFALGSIAFLIGVELEPAQIKKLGKTVFFGAFGQALLCVAVLALGMWGYMTYFTEGSADLTLGLVMGTIAAASAPAATMAVIEEYKAKGPLTSTVLGIVAVDDALGIILFTFAVGLAGQGSLAGNLGSAGVEVLGSIVLGCALGAILGLAGKRFQNQNFRLALIIATIIFFIGISSYWHLSYLLTGMVTGLVSKLVSSFETEEWHKPFGHIEETIFLLFFTVAGYEFVFSVFTQSLGFILCYIIFRISGKYTGAWIGARLAGAEKDVGRNLGLALMPHAGVAIGLALLAKSTPGLQQHGQLILNTILGATIFFAIVAPILTEKALQNAGEIDKK